MKRAGRGGQPGAGGVGGGRRGGGVGRKRMDDEVGKARGRRGDERRGRKEEGVDENDRRVADVAGRGGAGRPRLDGPGQRRLRSSRARTDGPLSCLSPVFIAARLVLPGEWCGVDRFCVRDATRWVRVHGQF
jgi:hypothetical protein